MYKEFFSVEVADGVVTAAVRIVSASLLFLRFRRVFAIAVMASFSALPSVPDCVAKNGLSLHFRLRHHLCRICLDSDFASPRALAAHFFPPLQLPTSRARSAPVYSRDLLVTRLPVGAPLRSVVAAAATGRH